MKGYGVNFGCSPCSYHSTLLISRRPFGAIAFGENQITRTFPGAFSLEAIGPFSRERNMARFATLAHADRQCRCVGVKILHH
jgi:hypothetical protein